MADTPYEPPRIVVHHLSRQVGYQLLYAIWDDGTMLCRARLCDPTSALIVGTVSSSDLERALADIRLSGFKEHCQYYMAGPESPLTEIVVRGDEGVIRGVWDEFMLVRYPDSHSFSVFVKSWLRTRAAIMSLPLVDSPDRLVDRLDKSGHFRRFRPSRPIPKEWLFD
ncbi:MAG: hypothetical protein H6811_05445 [Phycisphaeraceae bacterium]|nr:hypothetical protein [Phycisphaeraceae bacterium]